MEKSREQWRSRGDKRWKNEGDRRRWAESRPYISSPGCKHIFRQWQFQPAVTPVNNGHTVPRWQRVYPPRTAAALVFFPLYLSIPCSAQLVSRFPCPPSFPHSPTLSLFLFQEGERRWEWLVIVDTQFVRRTSMLFSWQEIRGVGLSIGLIAYWIK